MAYSVRPVRKPAGLNGVENGKLPATQLSTAPGGGRLQLIANRAWVAMLDAAFRAGWFFTPTSLGDLYRTFAAQESLFFQRYTRVPLIGRSTKTYQGETYWLKFGMAPAAAPGTSNHGWGLAIDVGISVDGKTLALAPNGKMGTPQRDAWDWLIAHYQDYGFSHEYSSPTTEPWHIRYVEGDDIPAAVLVFERPLPPPIVIPLPPVIVPPIVIPPLPPVQEDDEMPRLVQFYWDNPAVLSGVYVTNGSTARWVQGRPDYAYTVDDLKAVYGQILLWHSPVTRTIKLLGPVQLPQTGYLDLPVHEWASWDPNG